MFRLDVNTSTFSFIIRDGATQRTFTTSVSPTVLLDNTWRHVAVSVDRSRVTIYNAGIMKEMFSITTGLSDQDGGTLQLGGSPAGAVFTGLIESAVFFSQQLSEANIAPLAKVSKCLDPGDQALGLNCYVGFRVSPFCACPTSHPRILSTDETRCVNTAGQSTARYVVAIFCFVMFYIQGELSVDEEAQGKTRCLHPKRPSFLPLPLSCPSQRPCQWLLPRER